MSIRVILCFLYVLFFAFYTRRNLFISLCAVLLLMAVFQHPDMPKSIAGIPGLNLWNVLMATIVIAWLSNRRREGFVWDMPPPISVLLVLYFCVITLAAVRLLMNLDQLPVMTPRYVINEYILNCLKWVLPGIVLFDVCRTRRRVTIAMICVLGLYLLLALQVIKHVPLSAAASSDVSRVAAKQCQNNIGYNRVTLSMMLSGASWAALGLLGLASKRSHKLAVLGVAGIIALGQALTGGRSGYLAWGVVGLILCVVRWRKLLPVIPAVLIAVCVFLPGVRDRMLQGFAQGGNENIIVHNDEYEMTSGRNLAWPLVIEKIWESPILGYGREAMSTTGIFLKMFDEYGEGDAFPHPHNVYLEVLLDNGVVGFLIIVPFFLVVLWHGFRLLLDRTDPLLTAAGGMACALVLALLVAGMGGQTFYPREGAVGMWAAIGIMLRVSVERSRSRIFGIPLFGEAQESASMEVEDEPIAQSF